MSGGMQADWFIVFAKTGDPASRDHTSIGAFLVDADAPASPDPASTRRWASRASTPASSSSPTCGSRPHQVIGGRVRARHASLNAMRPIVAARGLGLAEGALMYATEYVKQRAAFGTTIAEFQGIQWEIAKLATEIEAARLLTYRAAWLADQGKFTKEYVPDALDVQVLRHRGRREGVRARGPAARRGRVHGGPPDRAVVPRRASAHDRRGHEPDPARPHRPGRPRPRPVVGLTRTPKIRTYTDEVRGPLDGLKVIELAGIGPAPYACMLLADLGADVLRLERGDVDADHESTWEILNRSRPSVAVDLKNAAGRDLVLELCERADVLIEGFRPGVTERLGLGPEVVAERNPRLVYGRMTGYGQEGPNAQRAGHDINYIAVSGALWPMGRKGEAPVPPLNLVGDFGGGSLFLAFGVVAAVLSARSTGEGQVVDAAMVDGTASLMALTHSLMNAGLWHEERGIEPARHGRTLL